jgi:hypothetical protein
VTFMPFIIPDEGGSPLGQHGVHDVDALAPLHAAGALEELGGARGEPLHRVSAVAPSTVGSCQIFCECVNGQRAGMLPDKRGSGIQHLTTAGCTCADIESCSRFTDIFPGLVPTGGKDPCRVEEQVRVRPDCAPS